MHEASAVVGRGTKANLSQTANHTRSRACTRPSHTPARAHALTETRAHEHERKTARVKTNTTDIFKNAEMILSHPTILIIIVSEGHHSWSTVCTVCGLATSKTKVYYTGVRKRSKQSSEKG